jgi:hypothetical protein
MNGIRRFQPSPAMAVPCLALFVALTGVSYAAVALPANSVGTTQLKPNAVNSVKVANRSLRAVDFALGQLPAGPAGQTGGAGPAGPKGDTGASGATKVVVRSVYLATGKGQVNCNAGETATGGGVTGDGPQFYVEQSEPTPGAGTPTGWKGGLANRASGLPGTGTVYVVCASP